MIKMETEYYCNDCPYFKAVQIFNVDSRETIIRCEDAHKCAELYKRFTAIDRAASIPPECDL